MEEIKIIKPKEMYIKSYWKTFDKIASEGKYFAASKGFSLDSTFEFIMESIDNDFPHLFAINEKNEVVGWCDIIPKQYEYLRHVGYMGMGILKNYRGRGLGQKLIEQTIQDAMKKNLKKVELDVFESNIRAINLYKKMGFFEEGKRIKGVKVNGNYEDLIQMGKFI